MNFVSPAIYFYTLALHIYYQLPNLRFLFFLFELRTSSTFISHQLTINLSLSEIDSQKSNQSRMILFYEKRNELLLTAENHE